VSPLIVSCSRPLGQNFDNLNEIKRQSKMGTVGEGEFHLQFPPSAFQIKFGGYKGV
jgi:hypothetical protein